MIEIDKYYIDGNFNTSVDKECWLTTWINTKEIEAVTFCTKDQPKNFGASATVKLKSGDNLHVKQSPQELLTLINRYELPLQG